MLFFFPDSQDLIDPSFDFETESRSTNRLRQRDDLYAHEVFSQAPYDGLLVSKSIVEDPKKSNYTLAQQSRFRREGVKSFLRVTPTSAFPLQVIGDCGAFNYIEEKVPPYSIDEVLGFYEEASFDLGISVDHVIKAYRPSWDRESNVPEDIRWRQEITLDLADEFLRKHQLARLSFIPIGVAQGWSPLSYSRAVHKLQQMGYRYIALGGMVGMKTPEILTTLEAINEVRALSTRLHLLGISRIENLTDYQAFGVASVDSTSPLKMAFKDDRNNYFTENRAYSAVRVPQVEGNARLGSMIRAGILPQKYALKLERECLESLKAFFSGGCTIEDVLPPLAEYGRILSPDVDRQAVYREVLEDQPWRRCPCEVCQSIGYNVILFRGAERNKRRGFHNLSIIYQRLQRGRVTNMKTRGQTRTTINPVLEGVEV